MKITYLIHSLYKAGGTEKVLTLKANYLADVCGEQVSVITANQAGRAIFFPLSESIYVYDLGVNIEGRRRLSEYKEALVDWLEKNPQDIVISLTGNEILILPFLRDGSKKIGELHFAYKDLFAWYGDSIFRKIKRSFRRQEILWSASRLDAFVVLTKAEEAGLSCKLKNIRQIYNPLPFPLEEKALLENKRFIAVGRLSREKNYGDMIMAWKDVCSRFPDWSLHIFGDGPFKGQLQQLIESEGLSGNVFLRGRTSEVEKEMKDSSGILLSSDTEAFPMALLEAAACGLPIVTYDCSPGIREIVKDGGNGFIVPKGDKKAMAERCLKLISDCALRIEMGARSQAIAESFSIDYVMRQWIDLFCELTGKD